MPKWKKHAIGASFIVVFLSVGWGVAAKGHIGFGSRSGDEAFLGIMGLSACVIVCVWIVFGVFLRDRYK